MKATVVGVAVASALLLAACSSSGARPDAAATSTRPASPSSSSIPRTTTTTSPPAIHIADGFALGYVPAGFTMLNRPLHRNGPIPGVSQDAVRYTGSAMHEQFAASVTRGTSEHLAVSPWMHRTTSIAGRPTFTGGDPITKSAEFTWEITPTVWAFVGGSMSEAELVRIANGMRISP